MRVADHPQARRACLLLALALACLGGRTLAQDEAPDESGTTAIRREFEAVAEALEAGSNPYVAVGMIPELRRKLGRESLKPRRRADLASELSKHLLRVGEVDEAIALARESRRLLGTLRASPARIQRAQTELALAYLRLGEVQNCIIRHNRECCIFPLENGGVHTVDAPARRSLALYLTLAHARPEDLRLRWMCNLLAMALDEHPDALPEDFVIPSAAFDSDADIGRFIDIAPRLGVATHSLCGGSAIEDFDGNGMLDILATTFDPRGSVALFLADGKGGYDARAEQANLTDQLGGLNLLTADYDNDGDADVFVLRGAWLLREGHIRNSLLRNDGSARFTDVTRAAGLAEPAQPTQTGVWADFDNDGHLDLYVGNESVRNTDGSHLGLASNLFRNLGDGTFTLTGEAPNKRYTKGVSAGDYDNDGDLDLYVSNVGHAAEQGINRLYENDGAGHLRDVAVEKNVHLPRVSFATWFFDFDNNGWLDLFVGAYDAHVADIASDYLGLQDRATRPRLYRNLDGEFEDIAEDVGIDRPFLPMGANFGDYDNDGWLDVYLATGNPRYETLMPNIALRNDAGRQFQDITRSAGLGHLQKGHGVTFGDLDNDGDQDIFHELGGFVPGDAFPNALFENPGHGHHFLKIELSGTTANRSGIGARIRVVLETPDGEREVHRAVGSVSSFGGAPRRQEIGLADATRIVSLDVRWPGSVKPQTFPDVPLDRLVRVVQEAPELEVLPLVAVEFD